MKKPKLVKSMDEWKNNVDELRAGMINKATMNSLDSVEGKPWYYMSKIDLIFFGVILILYIMCSLLGWTLAGRIMLILAVINGFSVLVNKGGSLWQTIKRMKKK